MIPYPTSLQSEFPTMPTPIHGEPIDYWGPVAMLQKRQYRRQKPKNAESKAISQSLRRL